MEIRNAGTTFLIILGLLVVTHACSREDPNAINNPLGSDHYFDLAIEGKSLKVQLAIEAEELRRGLMYREDLGENEGMIFIYSIPQRMTFWMRNTSLPLDVGFISSNGVLQEFYSLYPYDETSVVSRGEKLQFALELNQNWFQKNDINRGASLDLELLKKAIRLRGYDPSQFNLP